MGVYCYTSNQVELLLLQLTLERHGYKLCRSTYTWIFQLTPRLGIHVCGGPTVVICGFLILGEVGAPNPLYL